MENLNHIEEIAKKLPIVAGIIPKAYEAGIEEGKVRERETFWDTLLQDGNRSDFMVAGIFDGGSWDFNNFYPTRDIVIRGRAEKLFYNWASREAHRGSLIERLNECGVILDTSQATVLSNIFSYTYITEIPTIDCSNAPNSTGLFSYGWNRLKKIEKIIVTPNTTYTAWFTNDTDLIEIRVQGTIGQNGFDIHWSKYLSKASIESIITALDLIPTIENPTIKVSTTAVNKAFEDHEGDNNGLYSVAWAELRASRSNWQILTE